MASDEKILCEEVKPQQRHKTLKRKAFATIVCSWCPKFVSSNQDIVGLLFKYYVTFDGILCYYHYGYISDWSFDCVEADYLCWVVHSDGYVYHTNNPQIYNEKHFRMYNTVMLEVENSLAVSESMNIMTQKYPKMSKDKQNRLTWQQLEILEQHLTKLKTDGIIHYYSSPDLILDSPDPDYGIVFRHNGTKINQLKCCNFDKDVGSNMNDENDEKDSNDEKDKNDTTNGDKCKEKQFQDKNVPNMVLDFKDLFAFFESELSVHTKAWRSKDYCIDSQDIEKCTTLENCKRLLALERERRKNCINLGYPTIPP